MRNVNMNAITTTESEMENNHDVKGKLFVEIHTEIIKLSLKLHQSNKCFLGNINKSDKLFSSFQLIVYGELLSHASSKRKRRRK